MTALVEPHPSGLRVHARISEDFEALILSSSSNSDDYRILQELRSLLPSRSEIRRAIDGVRVPAAHADLLLQDHRRFMLSWTIDARKFAENRARALRNHSMLRHTLAELKSGGVTLAQSMIADSNGLDLLDHHQIVNVAAMTLQGSFGLCLFDEQGAGKTVTTIFAYDLLVQRRQVSRMLIVAPKSMVPEWEKDFARFRPRLYTVTSVAGSSREKGIALQSESDVYVTNFESVITMEPRFRSLLRLSPEQTILVVDESFFIKSPDAKRTRALRRLREWCGRAFVLCGTPAPNTPHDLVQQFNLVDFGTTFSGVRLPSDRKSAAPIVRHAIESRGIYLRHLKSDVLPDLPIRRFQRIYVPLQPKQHQLYERLRDRLVADLQAVTESQFRRAYSTFLGRRAALLQVCSNPSGVARGYTEIPAKLLLLDELLEHLIWERREKVIVWSFYTGSIDMIVDRYAELGVLRYDGKVTDILERSEAVRRFQEDRDMRLFVANPAAAGAGLTLHSSRVAIYESMSNQAAHYLQSLDRIHRRGQTREVDYVVLLSQATLEIVEYERLLEKQRMAGDLLGDVVSESTTRESFLHDLAAGDSVPVTA